MELNSKGQAAVTDAMYFLLVVTFLSIFLFGFANSYGNSIKQQINDEFSTTFATNALKTILYSSTTRSPGVKITDPDAEIDYLLVILKEDYADDQQLDSDEREVLGETISTILTPIEDQIDYIFLITAFEEANKDFIFFYIHTTNFIEEDADIPGRGFVFYRTDPDKPHANYFCAIKKDDDGDPIPGYDGFEITQKNLKRLLANIGPTSEAASTIRLTKINRSDGSLESIEAQVDLIMWNAIWLGKTADRSVKGLFYQENPDNAESEAVGWSCQESEFIFT